MRYFVAKAPDPETGEGRLHPDWFSIPVETSHNFAEIACKEYLKTKNAQRNKSEIVQCEITEIVA